MVKLYCLVEVEKVFFVFEKEEFGLVVVICLKIKLY